MKKSTLRKYMRKPCLIFKNLGYKEFLNWIPDTLYLKISYYLSSGKRLDLKNPKTFNEKLQWLKLNYRTPIMTQCVDKYEVRTYVENTIGSEYLIPLVGGPWNSFDEIDFNELPDQFVLKCTHDSGGLVICRDKSKLDKRKAGEKIKKCLKHNYFWGGREWPYKDIRPRIIAEKYLDLDDTNGQEFKLFCNYGHVRWVLVSAGKAHSTGDGGRTNDGYDLNFEHLPVSFTYPNADIQVKKPKQWDELVSLAEKISRDIPILRFDTYVVRRRTTAQ